MNKRGILLNLSALMLIFAYHSSVSTYWLPCVVRAILKFFNGEALSLILINKTALAHLLVTQTIFTNIYLTGKVIFINAFWVKRHIEKTMHICNKC